MEETTKTKATKAAEPSVFATLFAVDCTGKVEQKGSLSYLSWPFAWAEVKKRFPDATYTIYETANGMFYHTDGRTAWVKTGVTINGIEHIEYLPVMDNRHNSIPLANITSFNVNTAIQRSLTKACARHGLGLYIYAGEDLPEGVEAKYQPVSAEKYAAVIAAAALGRLAQGGGTQKEAWASATHAGKAELDQFDEDVYNYKVNNGIK